MEEECEEDLDLSTRKRLKTLIQNETLPDQPASLKGKEKMVVPESVEFSSSEGEVCGICFSEPSRSIRGRIDSCEHYFCFVCIMEWSKVESRCPMCKQRFGSIKRPPVHGVFLWERVVRVPVRDQVDHYGLAATADPYAEVNCSVCQSSVDENLLLLCDLCDSAAHTYCVGLGATVPEGDWFCSDCTITRNEHLKLEMEADCCGQDPPDAYTGDCNDNLPVSISDIVSEELSPSYSSSNTPLTRSGMSYSQTKLSSGVAAQNHAKHSFQSSHMTQKTISSSRATVIEQGARTLRRCRDVHDRVRRFRENWNGLQNGSLSFTARSVDFGKMGDDRKQQNISVNSSTSRQVQSSCPSKPEQTATEIGALGNDLCCTSAQDIVKAWKMMEAAKSIQKRHRDDASTYISSALGPVTKKNIPSRNLNSAVVLKQKSAEDRLSIAIGSGMQNYKSQNDERKISCIRATEDKCSEQKEALATNSLKNFNGLKSAQVTVSQGKMQEKISYQILNKEAMSIDERDLPTSSSVTYDKSKKAEFSKGERKPPKMNLQRSKTVSKSSSKTIDGAKSEVQSLVKLNLKLQLINRHLEGDEYKEVARVATHTILAACGLEHSKSCARSFPSLICKHPDQYRSNLMPSSCRQCFFSFVKEVVSSVLSDKA